MFIATTGVDWYWILDTGYWILDWTGLVEDDSAFSRRDWSHVSRLAGAEVQVLCPARNF